MKNIRIIIILAIAILGFALGQYAPAYLVRLTGTSLTVPAMRVERSSLYYRDIVGNVRKMLSYFGRDCSEVEPLLWLEADLARYGAKGLVDLALSDFEGDGYTHREVWVNEEGTVGLFLLEQDGEERFGGVWAAEDDLAALSVCKLG